MAQVSNTPTRTGARRRSQRVLMQVPVRIRGKNPQGVDFEEFTETLAINAHGALILLTARLTSGAVVHMRHNKTEEEQDCHVAFLGPVRGGRAEIGLEFTAPRPTFCPLAFPPQDWNPRSPEPRTVPGQRTNK